jgi:hypothetical protein
MHNPKERGSICYLDVSAENIEKHNPETNVTGIYFLTGRSGWIFTFSKADKEPFGYLHPGTLENFNKLLKELFSKKNQAFGK